MSSAEWYEVVPESDNSIHQCDILNDLRVIIPLDDLEVEGESDELPAGDGHITAMVLTQTCDLDRDDLTMVLVAKVNSWESVVEENKLDRGQARSWRNNIQKGYVTYLSLLPVRVDAPTIEWSVVNFRDLYSVPRANVDRHVQQPTKRLRLTPPHREMVSQAFARCFMRVAVVDDLASFREFET